MTREFKVGMTGKTTTDDAFVLIRRKGEWLYAFMDDASETGVIARFTLTGAGVTDFWGDLIHPDDAKEDTPTGAIEARNPAMEQLLREYMAGVNDINWPAARIQLVCAALTGLMANPGIIGKGGAYQIHDAEIGLAQIAMKQADAALARLSEKEG